MRLCALPHGAQTLLMESTLCSHRSGAYTVSEQLSEHSAFTPHAVNVAQTLLRESAVCSHCSIEIRGSQPWPGYASHMLLSRGPRSPQLGLHSTPPQGNSTAHDAPAERTAALHGGAARRSTQRSTQRSAWRSARRSARRSAQRSARRSVQPVWKHHVLFLWSSGRKWK